MGFEGCRDAAVNHKRKLSQSAHELTRNTELYNAKGKHRQTHGYERRMFVHVGDWIYEWIRMMCAWTTY